jgi:two-component system, OmpR family, KDP operon response regulator KdpE
MAGKPLVLVVAPERAVRLLVSAALRPAGFRVTTVSGHAPADDELTDLRPDVVVLEADETPSVTAQHVRRIERHGSTPVLLMSSGASPRRVAEMLDLGAADYIGRPFDPAELAARVRSLVRRRGDRLHAGRRRVGNATVDLDGRTIARDGTTVALTRTEWAILAFLLHNEGRILLREELLAVGFGEAARDDSALLRLAISRLRRKLGLGPWDEGAIRTIHGLGYAFDPEGSVPRAWSGRRMPSTAAVVRPDEAARTAGGRGVGATD